MDFERLITDINLGKFPAIIVDGNLIRIEVIFRIILLWKLWTGVRYSNISYNLSDWKNYQVYGKYFILNFQRSWKPQAFCQTSAEEFFSLYSFNILSFSSRNDFTAWVKIGSPSGKFYWQFRLWPDSQIELPRPLIRSHGRDWLLLWFPLLNPFSHNFILRIPNQICAKDGDIILF